jgi:ribosome recycling factor
MASILDSLTPKFQKVTEHLTQDLKGVKTGRAKPSLVEDISIEAYSTRMKVKELAAISAPDPRQIVITPWDRGLLEAISKGINSAGVNLNAIVDSDIIRINIAPLTTETRDQLVKLVWNKVESAKIMLRQVRAEIKKEVENQKDSGGISEDQIKRELETLQEKVQKTELELVDMGKAKEVELRSF